MEKQRFQFIDIARGLAIICIVLGHLGQANINRVVFTFHVPIFFLITGYFMNDKTSIKDFIKKKARTLIVPYFVACIFIIAAALLMNRVMNGGYNDRAVLERWVWAAIYGAGDSYDKPFVIYQIGALWFLLATFWGSILLRCSLELKPIKRILLILFIFVISCRSSRICWLPFSIQAGGPALLYMYIGYLAKAAIPAVRCLGKEIKLVLVGAALWIWAEFVVHFESFWLVHCDYGRGVIDIAGSLCACLCVLLFSYWLSNRCNCVSKILSYFGRYSLFVLCMHIIELDVFPWRDWIIQIYPGSSDLVIFLMIVAGKFIWIFSMTFICSRWKWTRKIFGYSVDKR